jgi:hypothetical protein
MPLPGDSTIIFGNVDMPYACTEKSERIDRISFFDVGMEGVIMDTNIRLTNFIDETPRVLLSVKKICLKAIEGFDA